MRLLCCHCARSHHTCSSCSVTLQSVVYRGFLAPEARSEIGVPVPDFFLIQNGRPKTNLGHFQKRVFKLFTNLYLQISWTILNFSMTSDKYVPKWLVYCFLYKVDSSAPVNGTRHMPHLPFPPSVCHYLQYPQRYSDFQLSYRYYIMKYLCSWSGSI